MAVDNKFWIRLSSIRDPSRKVVFNSMPVLNESAPVQYTQLSPVHMPGTFQVYENTPGRTFEISDIKLVSRNSIEARENLNRLNMLRSWRMPYFGTTTAPSGSNIDEAQVSELKNYFGAPPEILYLNAYADDTHRGHLYKIPVVLASLSIPYTNEVDYIPTAGTSSSDVLGGVPFPTLMSISISLNEQHSADEFERFNLAAYRTAQLVNF